MQLETYIVENLKHFCTVRGFKKDCENQTEIAEEILQIGPTDDVLFFYMELQKKNIELVLEKVQNIGHIVKKIIFLHDKKTVNKSCVEVLNKTLIDTECLGLCLFKINVLDHPLVPQHRKATVPPHLRINKNKLPKLLANDPVCLWCGFKKGDVVEIKRSDDNVFEDTTYRIVV